MPGAPAQGGVAAPQACRGKADPLRVTRAGRDGLKSGPWNPPRAHSAHLRPTGMLSRAEASFYRNSLVPSASKYVRADGRSAFKFRPISITTGVSAHSHGSARCRLTTTSDGVVTDVLVGCKLDVEERTFDTRASVLECSVDFPPAALISLPNDPSQQYTAYLNSLLSPLKFGRQLKICTTHCWGIYVDVLVLTASAGNVMDVMCLAVRAALGNLQIPRTSEVGYQRTKPPEAIHPMEIEPNKNPSDVPEQSAIEGLLRGNPLSGTKSIGRVFDFELRDVDADQGDHLINKEDIPVVISMNIIDQIMFLDATLEEESISSNKLILAYSDQGRRLSDVFQTGNKSEIGLEDMRAIVREGSRVAQELSRHLE
ncbi:hypothetical protein O181_016969 [Austropuccinia psidii MF-1]|uniref:Ribosomal RNA-processing protein 42 n=1 Tax=Austropuccinia psidii MF-1 TaxID=1389203 RepID=A0A9Q3C2P3_9BASI|nr:hypothetical protein [Austropuccinia psidii MF-1]